VPDNKGQASSGVSQLQTGKVETLGKGKNQTITFTLTDVFIAGDAVGIRALVVDANTGLPPANTVVDLSIVGPESVALTTSPSDASGIAEAIWKTSAGNRKGHGPTTSGSYTARVTNVTVDGYTWDGVGTAVDFTLR
jgi:hypothetical protein